jgi:hypothetical protein
MRYDKLERGMKAEQIGVLNSVPSRKPRALSSGVPADSPDRVHWRFRPSR